MAGFATQPDQTRRGLIDTCIGSLKSGGVWAKAEAIYFCPAADSQAARVNWKAPGTYNLTSVGATHTVDRGWSQRAF